MIFLFVIFCVLQIADAYLTDRILKAGGRELNPVMRKMMEKLGRVPALYGLKAAYCLILWYFLPAIPMLLLVVLCVGYAVVVVHNASEYV